MGGWNVVHGFGINGIGLGGAILDSGFMGSRTMEVWEIPECSGATTPLEQALLREADSYLYDSVFAFTKRPGHLLENALGGAEDRTSIFAIADGDDTVVGGNCPLLNRR